MENPNTEPRPAIPAEPARDGLADAKATLAAYEGNLVGAMDAAADWLEARIAEAQAEADALHLDELVALLKETSDYHYELADTADEGDEDSAQACRVQSAAIWRAAEMLEKLAKEGGSK